MNHAAEMTGYGFSFGYVDDQGQEMGLGSGNRTFIKKFPYQIAGGVDGNDTMEIGSGTKGFTSTAIMRLVDQGKVKLSDPAHIHINPVLQARWNVTMYELFGLWAHDVTVHNLIFMQSGIADYEIGTYDNDLLMPNQSHSVHDPLEPLRFIS